MTNRDPYTTASAAPENAAADYVDVDQSNVEAIAQKIWAENKLWMSYSQAYIKAVRLLNSVQ